MVNETKQTETKKSPRKSPSKVAASSKSTAKTAPASKVTEKPTVESGRKQPVTPLERWRMIAEAAYYRAEKRGFFGGNPMEDWAAAEREIDTKYAVDLSKVMTVFDPSEMMEELSKALSHVELPGVDVRSVLEAQRKNVEALTLANQRAFEAGRAMLDRQMEMLKQALTEASGALTDLSASKSPAKAAAKQGELFKQLMERALSTLREMTDLVTNANADALKVIRDRVEESIKEIRQASKRTSS
ncbi:MAG: TIGR01841 family phasin [Gammaproteobacteria bacterium]